VYTSLTSRVGLSTSNGQLTGSSRAYVPLWYQDSLLSLRLDSTSSFPHMGSKGGVTVSAMTVSGGQKRDSTISICDQLSILSISVGSDLKPDFKIEQHSPSDHTASSSASGLEAELYDSSSEFTTTSVTHPPATVPPVLAGTVEPTIRPGAPTCVVYTAHALNQWFQNTCFVFFEFLILFSGDTRTLLVFLIGHRSPFTIPALRPEAPDGAYSALLLAVAIFLPPSLPFYLSSTM
jgi:hypothetical protein